MNYVDSNIIDEDFLLKHNCIFEKFQTTLEKEIYFHKLFLKKYINKNNELNNDFKKIQSFNSRYKWFKIRNIILESFFTNYNNLFQIIAFENIFSIFLNKQSIKKIRTEYLAKIQEIIISLINEEYFFWLLPNEEIYNFFSTETKKILLSILNEKLVSQEYLEEKQTYIYSQMLLLYLKLNIQKDSNLLSEIFTKILNLKDYSRIFEFYHHLEPMFPYFRAFKIKELDSIFLEMKVKGSSSINNWFKMNSYNEETILDALNEEKLNENIKKLVNDSMNLTWISKLNKVNEIYYRNENILNLMHKNSFSLNYLEKNNFDCFFATKANYLSTLNNHIFYSLQLNYKYILFESAWKKLRYLYSKMKIEQHRWETIFIYLESIFNEISINDGYIKIKNKKNIMLDTINIIEIIIIDIDNFVNSDLEKIYNKKVSLILANIDEKNRKITYRKNRYISPGVIQFIYSFFYLKKLYNGFDFRNNLIHLDKNIFHDIEQMWSISIPLIILLVEDIFLNLMIEEKGIVKEWEDERNINF